MMIMGETYIKSYDGEKTQLYTLDLSVENEWNKLSKDPSNELKDLISQMVTKDIS